MHIFQFPSSHFSLEPTVMPGPYHLPSYCLSGTNGTHIAKASDASLDLTQQEYFTLRARSSPDIRKSPCPGFTLTPLVTPCLYPLLVPLLFLQSVLQWDCSDLNPHSIHCVCSHLVISSVASDVCMEIHYWMSPGPVRSGI